MDEQKKETIKRTLRNISFALVFIVLAYILYSAFVLKRIGTGYYVAIIGFLIVFWVLNDVAPVFLAKELEGKTEEQKKNYRIYAGLNLVGLAGLGYFATSMQNNNGMTGALIYVAATMFRRKYKDAYDGITEDANEEMSTAETAGEAELSTAEIVGEAETSTAETAGEAETENKEQE